MNALKQRVCEVIVSLKMGIKIRLNMPLEQIFIRRLKIGLKLKHLYREVVWATYRCREPIK